MMRRKAMTLAEVLTGLMILAVLAGVMTLNSNTIGQQTARREADRVAAFFRAHLQRANMTREILWFTVSTTKTPNTIEASTDKHKDTLKAMEKCSFSTSTNKLVYNKSDEYTYKTISDDALVDVVEQKQGNAYYVEVKGADGQSCFVRISK